MTSTMPIQLYHEACQVGSHMQGQPRFAHAVSGTDMDMHILYIGAVALKTRPQNLYLIM